MATESSGPGNSRRSQMKGITKIADQDLFSFLLNWLAVKSVVKKQNKTKENKKKQAFFRIEPRASTFKID